MQRITQAELAQRAGVDTKLVYRAERGIPVRESSLRKVCEGLGMKFDEFLRMKPVFSPERDSHLVHRASGAYWYAPEDRRRMLPEDNEALLQDAAERRRLGVLGLAPLFVCYPDYIMPEGPGTIQLEVHGRFESPIALAYRDCTLQILRGGLRLGIRDDVVELAEGDSVGLANHDLRWIEPLEINMRAPSPTLVLWVGAVRLGKILTPPGKRTIVRKPR